jgi:hypothetical protein
LLAALEQAKASKATSSLEVTISQHLHQFQTMKIFICTHVC